MRSFLCRLARACNGPSACGVGLLTRRAVEQMLRGRGVSRLWRKIPAWISASTSILEPASPTSSVMGSVKLRRSRSWLLPSRMGVGLRGAGLPSVVRMQDG